MIIQSNGWRLLALGYCVLTACGGGSSAGVAVAPIPMAPPSPAPALPPATPSPPNPVTTSTSTEFTSVGSDIKIRFDAGSQKYEILLPGQSWAILTPEARSSFAFTGAGGAKNFATFSGGQSYSYTGFAGVYDSEKSLGEFAYGIPTPAASVPVTGSANYTAELLGNGDFYSLGGTAKLNFDFGKGALSGSMSLEGNDPAGWGPYKLGDYDFVRAVYSAGSPTFSGELASTTKSGLGGSFSGSLTGPGAQELMGKWQVQFDDYWQPGRTVIGTGVMVGKK